MAPTLGLPCCSPRRCCCFGVTVSGVLGQRAIYGLGAGVRSRLNGLYMAAYFAGGAAGSALCGWSYAHGGWSLTM